eukprot:15457214-Alexandrium_andersonii.AAC.1
MEVLLSSLLLAGALRGSDGGGLLRVIVLALGVAIRDPAVRAYFVDFVDTPGVVPRASSVWRHKLTLIL